MYVNIRARRIQPLARIAGFSMVEVMVAMLVLAVGLLGFAMLQSMTIRFTQSANHRTHATNLAYEMLDQIRLNRAAGPAYAGTYVAGTTGEEGCDAHVVGTGLTPAQFSAAWSCRMGLALGDTAEAQVTVEEGVYSVDIRWNDERWTETGSRPDFTVSAEI